MKQQYIYYVKNQSEITQFKKVDYKQLRFICDAPYNWQYGFQDPATPIIEGIINFHHDLIYFIIIIILFVLWILLRTISLFSNTQTYHTNNTNHNTALEIIWTIIPAVILVIIALPSFALLYAIDEIYESELTIKIIGRQWYWVYEPTDESIITTNIGLSLDDDNQYESRIILEDDLLRGQYRLLQVDNTLQLPLNIHTRLLITSGDVLHSWAVPSLGIKIDACPGRLNQINLFVKRSGIYYGQCSEICGIQHSFIPICVEVLNQGGE